MNIAVLLAESALADLEAVRDWYEKEGAPDTGTRLVEAIVGRIETLREHPDIGRIVPEFGQPYLRELIHPPFRVVYRRDPTHVRVVRVWRGERSLVLPPDQRLP